MVRLIFRLLFWLKGWKVNVPFTKEEMRKSVMVAAPHTSNWDIVFAVEAFRQMGVKLRFAIKREWMFFPLNLAIGPMGGIGIDRRPMNKRDKKLSMVDAMVRLFDQYDELAMMIPPEGTRSLAKRWRSGFYQVALQANVPIILGYLDYKNKEAGATKMIMPSGDFEKDMREIMEYYKGIEGKFPENFALDKRYIN
ncbi:1-acyl-sn-glycerol-3-phosphate acyltransferase [Sediminitomix flava]|uniref:Acyltransferase-like protein n=1 Tax=Sediminitomix flava TaxID=379075 RepID=A0A315Z9M7_SEDFL|nr:1-acyl-sn-glycerol-3-phosphate acyltransferase [Sediminitomix flava]PWJ40904.1 acyltransferase-like protein [Sediminitomix flava]